MEHDLPQRGALGRRSLGHRLVRLGREAHALLSAARRDHGADYVPLVARFFDLYVRRQYSLDEIGWLDLLGPGHSRADLDLRPSKQALLRMQVALNPREYWMLTEDKRIFDLCCRAAGLPVPRSHGTFAVVPSTAPAQVRRRAREQAAELLCGAPADELVLKPGAGVHGTGVRHLRRRGDGFTCSDGAYRRARDVYDWVEAGTDAGGEEFIVQDHLKAHAALQQLTGSSNLSTVRIVTYVSRAGDVFIGGCELRVIVGASLVDNFRNGRNGNLIADIPDGRGRVGQAFGVAAGGVRCVRYERHPQTGMPLEGFEVPFWGEACRLVERAALAMLPLRTIGWDVGITEAGPLLVEGNVTWDPANEGVVGAEVIRAVRSDTDDFASGAGLVRGNAAPVPCGSAGSGIAPQR